MKNNNIFTIVGKEFARFFGDRTLLFTAVIMPGLLIYIIYSLMGENLSEMNKLKTDLPPAVYVDNMPESLAGDFDSLPYTVYTSDFNAIALIGDSLNDKECNLVYVAFPAHFDSLVAAYSPNSEESAPNVRIYYNSSSTNSMAAYSTVTGILDSWEYAHSNMFDINAQDPDTEESFDMADEDQTLGDILAQLIPMLLMMLMFSGCMAVAPSSIAGEKERGTIAPLLVTPMRRHELATGKILSLATFAMLSGFSSFLGIILSLPKMAHTDDLGLGLTYGFGDYFMLLCVLLSTVLIMVSCVAILSAFAKDVKSAGTLVLPLMILIMFIGFTPMLGNGAPDTLGIYLIPFYNSVQAMASIFSFDLNGSAIVITVLSNLVYTAIAILGLTKMFNSEKVMFGR